MDTNLVNSSKASGTSWTVNTSFEKELSLTGLSSHARDEQVVTNLLEDEPFTCNAYESSPVIHLLNTEDD